MDKTSVPVRSLLLMMSLSLFQSGCGLHASGFLTPVYRRPSGYSETYLDHLNSGVPPRNVLLDPALAELPMPVPLPMPEPNRQMPFPGAMPGGIGPNDRMPFEPETKTKKSGTKSGSQKR